MFISVSNWQINSNINNIATKSVSYGIDTSTMKSIPSIQFQWFIHCCGFIEQSTAILLCLSSEQAQFGPFTGSSLVLRCRPCDLAAQTSKLARICPPTSAHSTSVHAEQLVGLAHKNLEAKQFIMHWVASFFNYRLAWLFALKVSNFFRHLFFFSPQKEQCNEGGEMFCFCIDSLNTHNSWKTIGFLS